MIISNWVTHNRQTVKIGSAAAPFYVRNVHMYLKENFNSNGTDKVTVGHSGDVDAYVASMDVDSGAGTDLTVTVVDANRYNTVPREINVYYTNGGSEPSAGELLVILEIDTIPLLPA